MERQSVSAGQAAQLLAIFVLMSLCGVRANTATDKPEWFFWNEVTGETQWEDPGDVPHEDSDGVRYWLNADGQRHTADPNSYQYVWVEQWSEEHGRPYFYNQQMGQSTWEKPMDMAWRRIRARDEL